MGNVYKRKLDVPTHKKQEQPVFRSNVGKVGKYLKEENIDDGDLII